MCLDCLSMERDRPCPRLARPRARTGKALGILSLAAALTAPLTACGSGGQSGTPDERPVTASVGSTASASPTASASSPAPSAAASSAPVGTVSPAAEETTASADPAEQQSSEAGLGDDAAASGPSAAAGAEAGGESAPEGAGQQSTAAGSCGTQDFQVHLSPRDSSAGAAYYTLTFTNASDHPCTLAGYPEAAFVDAEGNTIGAPASRATDMSGSSRTLRPGESSASALRLTQADLLGQQCQRTMASGLRVSAPGDDQSLTVPWAATVCGSDQIQQLSVSPLGNQRG